MNNKNIKEDIDKKSEYVKDFLNYGEEIIYYDKDNKGYTGNDLMNIYMKKNSNNEYDGWSFFGEDTLCPLYLNNYRNGLSSFNKNYILSSLSDYDSIFKVIYRFSNIIFDPIIPTACVSFNEYSTDKKFINMKFNPYLWNALNTETKLFIICHECMHIIYEHGYRLPKKDTINIISEDEDSATLEINYNSMWNIATDIFINHNLLNNFKFLSNNLNIWFTYNLSFIDTVFKEQDLFNKVLYNKNSDYYFYLLLDKSKEEQSKIIKKFLDGDILDLIQKCKSNGKISKNNSKKIKDEIQKDISRSKNAEKKVEDLNKELQDLDQTTEPGNEESNTKYKIPSKKNTKAYNWNLFLKNVLLVDDVNTNYYSFNRINNKYLHIMKNNNIIIPSELDDSDIGYVKPSCAVYMDVSGSCIHLTDRFWEVVNSIPEDLYSLNIYVFDVSVREVKKGDTIHDVGGGTSFYCIVDHYNKLKQKPIKSFVITDGFGDNCSDILKNPSDWIWLLEKNNSSSIDNLKKMTSDLCQFYYIDDIEINKK